MTNQTTNSETAMALRPAAGLLFDVCFLPFD
jgi:hypothetical protein